MMRGLLLLIKLNNVMWGLLLLLLLIMLNDMMWELFLLIILNDVMLGIIYFIWWYEDLFFIDIIKWHDVRIIVIGIMWGLLLLIILNDMMWELLLLIILNDMMWWLLLLIILNDMVWCDVKIIKWSDAGTIYFIIDMGILFFKYLQRKKKYDYF